MKNRNWYAMTKWHPDDIIGLDVTLNDTKARMFLEECERHIQSAIVEQSWDIIEIILHDWKDDNPEIFTNTQ